MQIRLVEDNLSQLSQLRASVLRLENTEYELIGGHVRHVLDHYHQFLMGLETGCVNYDNRSRDFEVEVSKLRADQYFEAVDNALTAIISNPSPDRSELFIECSTNHVISSQRISSTVPRELQFLHSHTVHHMALIRTILVERGVPCDSEFGVAPATLAHQRSAA
ncbi:MAG: hypothetical protein AAF402_08445 [Pseudomonadota bacterium]